MHLFACRNVFDGLYGAFGILECYFSIWIPGALTIEIDFLLTVLPLPPHWHKCISLSSGINLFGLSRPPQSATSTIVFLQFESSFDKEVPSKGGSYAGDYIFHITKEGLNASHSNLIRRQHQLLPYSSLMWLLNHSLVLYLLDIPSDP